MSDAQLVRLGDCCDQDRASVRPGDGAELRYIGLETIESGTGLFQMGELSKTPETPQANSFRFGPEHVLYGKLRPYLNKVALPDFVGKCSTEIIPLKPRAGLDRRYLAYFLRSASVVDRISKRTAGARMPRADMDFVLDLRIPLPALDEQYRIVDLLFRAEGIVRLRREAQAKAAEIIPALFLDMFGDPATNPKGWARTTIGADFDVKGGKRLPKDAPYSPMPTEFRYIRGTDIHPDEIDSSSLLYLSPDVQAHIARYVVQSDDVVITIAGKIGVAAPVRTELAGVNLTENAAMIRARDRQITRPTFLSTMINSTFVQSQVESLTGRVTIGKLALERIKLLSIVVPPLALQDEYEARVNNVRALTATQALATACAIDAFNALLGRVFSRGGLIGAMEKATEAAVA